jgi:serine/threonine protein kinase
VWRTVDKVYEQLPYVGGISLQQSVAPRLGGLAGGMRESFHNQVSRVLETLHSAGIVHRDVHPANIYLVVRRPSELAELSETDAESAWIFDAFGEAEEAFLVAWVVVDLTFATLADAGDQEPYRHGPYTPEEQQDGAATTASDMYAFGATMFFGQTGDDPPSPLDRRVNPRAAAALADVAGLPPSERYVRRLLKLDPAERPPATEQLREGSVAPGFCGVLRVGDDQFALVDMFPSLTRLRSRRDALRELRRRQRDAGDEWRQWLGLWVGWLAALPPRQTSDSAMFHTPPRD